MNQITKKEFIETLSNNETILVDSLFRGTRYGTNYNH